jgi:DNA-binding CsgD family transcriptional regulator
MILGPSRLVGCGANPMDSIGELEKVSDLCGRIDYPSGEANVTTELLEPIASYLDAETASFRVLVVERGTARPDRVVSLGIPDSVDDAYLAHYHKLDPARMLLERRLAQPVFAHATRPGQWSQELASPAALHRYRQEFVRYRREFLLPNRFVHHVGFCFQDFAGRTVLFDFHRGAGSHVFSQLEFARAEIVAYFLHAKAARCRHLEQPCNAATPDERLSARELEVAESVALGLSNKEVAGTLAISVRTVENHMRSIFAKLGVTTRTRLAAKLHEAAQKRLAAPHSVGLAG